MKNKIKGLIIAAGMGSRLYDLHQGEPKTLLKIGERSIIDIILSNIYEAGLNEVIIVTGYESAKLKATVQKNKPADLNITFVHNPQWELPNGLSVLCAQEYILPDEHFVLFMSDHLFDTRLLTQMLELDLLPNQNCIALDFKLDKIYDMDDAMKVQIGKLKAPVYQVKHFSKSLAEYQAVDCGMFKLQYNFFQALETARQAGKCSLSEGCNILCEQNLMLGYDIGDLFWLDVDTPDAYAYAKQVYIDRQK